MVYPSILASQGRPMKLLSHTDDKVTIEFTLHELHLASALIQEGRRYHECDSPNGQALEDGIRSIVIRLEEAAKSDFESGGTH
jgi:hypothetical protein